MTDQPQPQIIRNPGLTRLSWVLVGAVAFVAVASAGVAIKGWPLSDRPGVLQNSGDWCAEHGVPESLCTLCQPELRNQLVWCDAHGLPEAICTLCSSPLKGQLVVCEEHGLPEAFCTQCNPTLVSTVSNVDWCAEHGVPESKCSLCNPGVAGDLCQEHHLPEALCTLCHPELAEQLPTCSEHGLPPAFCLQCQSSRVALGELSDVATMVNNALLLPKGAESAELCRLDLPSVRLASAQTMVNAGLEVARVEARSLSQKVTCNARISYNENRYAQVRPRVDGIVHEVPLDVGAKVRRGDVLAVIDSVDLGNAKADYLSVLASLDLAESNMGRVRNLVEKQIVPSKQQIEAETQLAASRFRATQAKQRLMNLGISPQEIDKFTRSNDTNSLLQITAPLDGVIVRRSAVVGEAVERAEELFAVADITNMWAHLDLYENDLRWVQEGQPVTLFIDSLFGDGFTGKVTWISPEVNPRTRTIQVRTEVENPRGLLRSGMYGRGVIQVSAPNETLVVPKVAVQWHNRSPVVFVKKSDELYQPRRVSLGRKEGPFWEVHAGVRADELVVTTGSFLLKTELMKGSIGAGCCGE